MIAQLISCFHKANRQSVDLGIPFPAKKQGSRFGGRVLGAVPQRQCFSIERGALRPTRGDQRCVDQLGGECDLLSYSHSRRY
jgi:hypothetical protein